jgi:ferritin
MIKLYDNTSGALLGTIDERQLQFLMDNMEEEFLEDQDYAITALTIDYLAEQGADVDLLDLLRGALDDADEVTIRWSKG